MRTEHFFGAKYHQCGKCCRWTTNIKSGLTPSGEDLKTSKQHHGLCEPLHEKSQELLNSLWLGTSTSGPSHARKNIGPAAGFLKKFSKELFYTISKIIQASMYQNPFYSRKINATEILQELSQFRWCPSLSNDIDNTTSRVQLIRMS